jgi:hypothetical protein
MMLFEPMNRVVAEDEPETLWHVGRGSSPWSPDPNTVIISRLSRRRQTLPPAVILTPNCKTPDITAAANATVTRESAERQPPDTNLTRSEDRREDQATCPPTSLVRATPRWRKSRGKLFRRDAIFSIERRPKKTLANPNYLPEPILRGPHPLPSPERPTEEAGTDGWPV